jgi:DNA-directed RNA polymerase specialized sigma24 family protein
MDDTTPGDFERFLTWIHTDPDEAARLYNEYHRKLTWLFQCKGWPAGEDLADKTIKRVMQIYDPEDDRCYKERYPFFSKTANYIHREELKKIREVSLPEDFEVPDIENDQDDSEQELVCLDNCLGQLSAEERWILEYHEEEKQAKKTCRKKLAERLGITVESLRIRACRIRARVYSCMEKCLESSPIAETPRPINSL